MFFKLDAVKLFLKFLTKFLRKTSHLQVFIKIFIICIYLINLFTVSSISAENDVDDSDSITGCTKVLNTPETYIHALYGNSDIYQLNRTLSSVEPRYYLHTKFISNYFDR